MAVIDEESLDAEGRWPWPRSKIAALITALSRDGAKVIGFDIAFVEPDENSELGFIDRLGRKVDALGIKDPRLATFIGDSKVAADNDLALANAIRGSSAAVILGYFFHMSQADLGQPLEPRRDRPAARANRGVEVPFDRLPPRGGDGCRPLHQSLRAGDEPRGVLGGDCLGGLLQRDQ